MTDGERLVWATTYALAFDRSGDSTISSRAAANAIEHLRSAAQRKLPSGELAIVHSDEREFLDEIVSVP